MFIIFSQINQKSFFKQENILMQCVRNMYPVTVGSGLTRIVAIFCAMVTCSAHFAKSGPKLI